MNILIPLLLLGGAYVVTKKSVVSMPITDKKNSFWAKAYPNKPVGDMDLSEKYWEEYFKSPVILQKGDWISVGVQVGRNNNPGVVPDGKKGVGWGWIEDMMPAQYVVVHAPRDPVVVERGRRVVLKAHLLLGTGPKTWTIYDRKSKKDKRPPRYSSFASRAINRGIRPQYESNYSTDGDLFFPEIHRIQRSGSGTIFMTSHFHDIGRNVP